MCPTIFSPLKIFGCHFQDEHTKLLLSGNKNKNSDVPKELAFKKKKKNKDTDYVFHCIWTAWQLGGLSFTVLHYTTIFQSTKNLDILEHILLG